MLDSGMKGRGGKRHTVFPLPHVTYPTCALPATPRGVTEPLPCAGEHGVPWLPRGVVRGTVAAARMQRGRTDSFLGCLLEQNQVFSLLGLSRCQPLV